MKIYVYASELETFCIFTYYKCYFFQYFVGTSDIFFGTNDMFWALFLAFLHTKSAKISFNILSVQNAYGMALYINASIPTKHERCENLCLCERAERAS